MGSSHDLVVVTSRQHVIQDATLEWIDRHYPGLFQEVYFGNHFALEGVSRKKSDICRQVNVSTPKWLGRNGGLLYPAIFIEFALQGVPHITFIMKHDA